MKWISLLFIVILYTACSGTRKAPRSPMAFAPNPIIAHRGAWKKMQLPENSVAALKQAIALQCNGSEFDVRITADDSLVVNHDPDYHKMPIEQTTYAELTKIPLSNGEPLPTLRAYLLAGINNNTTTKLVCEIKPSPAGKEKGKMIAGKVLQLVREVNATAYTEYISFDYEILKELVRLNPRVKTQYLNGDKAPAQLKADGISGLDYHYSVFKNKPHWITEAKELGLILNAWTVNDPADMDWLLAHGVNLLTTNEPELLSQRVARSPLAKNWKLVWADEFNYTGIPDSTKWNYDVGGHGWGNNELQYYTRADSQNVWVKNGRLHITARRKQTGKNSYTSARIISKGKGDWLYGRIEVGAKLPSGRGMWPAIWMLPTDWAYGGWPESGEIDIMEHVGYMPDSVFSTIHTKSFHHSIGTQKSKGLQVQNPYTVVHEYAVEWFSDHIDFFVDDVWLFSFSNSGKGFTEWPFDKRFHLLMNIAVGGDWGGKMGVDETITAATIEVDYVRVYHR